MSGNEDLFKNFGARFYKARYKVSVYYKIRYSLTDYYKAQNVSDLILRTKDENGFKSEDITKLEEAYGKNNVNTGVQIDADIEIGGEVQTVRLYFLNEFGDDWTVNVPDIKEGEKPENEMQALCENSDNKIKGFSIGTDICLNFEKILIDLADEDSKETVKNQLNLVKKLGVELEKNISVEGIVQSPLTFANDGEPNDRNPEDIEVPDNITDANLLQTLDNVLYLSSEAIPKLPSFLGGKGLIPTNAVYLSFSDKDKFSAFDKSYSNYLEEQTAAVCGMLNLAQGQETVKILTLNENYSFVSLIAYADKVMNIGFVLMVAFLFVTALVVLSNMTRLLEEERGQIACLRTLGYSAFRIIFKYILFAMLATGIGGVASYFVGLGLAYLICYVFNYSFTMPPISSQVALPFFLIVFFVIVAATLIATLAAGLKMSKETPANLLRPKPPKAGKKVFLERIPLIWNRLSFKYKSTMRNVLRYMNRFIMTVVSVAVSTALVLAGLALLDVCLFGGIDSPSVMGIAIVVIVFAGLLTAVVIYTLTNINISERNRELATLKVLGYQDKEIAGYIYREVYIDTAVGILFGYPLSLGIMKILFGIMAVGSITSVKWFWWLAAPFLVLFFTFLVTMILTRKIVKIDMNESLKAIE